MDDTYFHYLFCSGECYKKAASGEITQSENTVAAVVTPPVFSVNHSHISIWGSSSGLFIG